MAEETNPLTELPAEVLEEMSPGERLAYLLYADEGVPPEVTKRALELLEPGTVGSMPKILMINTAVPNIRLAPGVDTQDLLRQLADGAKTGDVVQVPAVLPDRMPGQYTVHVNPSAAVWWTVIEDPDVDS
ncbi:hypothetical protein [Microtetraspora malaysiensis]|uniref:hypothetical protein n=1 Tax=Microtetraspora malaysiensis TaxID=161358 RepID=UPI003D918371